MAHIKVYPHRCSTTLLAELGYKGDPEKTPFTLEATVTQELFEKVKKTKGALCQVIDDEVPARKPDLAGAATQLEDANKVVSPSDTGKPAVDGDAVPAAPRATPQRR